MQLSPTQQAILRWRSGGPCLFAKEVLGADPTDQQWDASRNLVLKRRVSIRSGHGTGKSTFMAWCDVVPGLVFPGKGSRNGSDKPSA